MVRIYVSLVVACLALVGAAYAKDMQCYVCSSYMDQCKEKVEVNKHHVHKTKCKTACFVRIGDDDAMYRGCFDGYVEVPELKALHGFTGCRNETWNNRDLPWCLCGNSLCNFDSMHVMEGKPRYYKDDSETNQVETGDYAPFKPQALTQESYEVKDINHAQVYSMDFTYPKVKEPNYYDKLDDFNHGLDKLPEEDEPEEEDEEEYDPYSQPKYDRPAYDEYYRSNPTYNNEDVYMYPPFRNEPPYGNTRFYPETNFVGENSGYEAPPPALSQEPPKELYPNPDRYEMPVQEDYPPPQLSYKEFREEEPPQEEVYNEVVEDEKKKEVDTSKEAFPEHLAARIQCAKTGFYQNPDDCRTFVACVLDPYYRKPYMHLMRCPAGLVWDNEIQICMEYSSTCNVGGFYSQKHSKLAVPTGYEDPEPVQYDPPPQEPYHEEEAPVADNNQDDNEAYQQPTQQDPIEYQDIGPSYFPPQHRGGYYDAEEEPQEKFYEPVDYQPKK